ncbi:hypothetical protein [Marimonas lutisalis]|uniref:hypothetical protein n=1 Tax=Marimonas lutisalis TaxID=2545756 RepID=UPI0010F55DA1|nr:hypothetical protein [Marimonas lutisalis]
MKWNFDWGYVGAMGAVVGLCGVVVAGAMLAVFGWSITSSVPAWLFLPGAGAGAALAGMATAGLFGHQGVRGFALAILGSLAATVLGATLAGILLLSPHRMDLVAAALLFSLFSPVVLLWLGAMALAHWAATRLRDAQG